MDKDDRKDIFEQGIDYSYISFISQKLRVGIVGGGKAGEIKAKHFVKNECYVEVLSKTFSKGIIELEKYSQKFLKLINEEFNCKFIHDKHLIIIAVDDENLKKEIKKYCNDNYKIYIDSSDFSQGMGVIPVQRNTKNVSFALNTKYGNPKGAVFLSNKVESLIGEYDNFMEFIGNIRTKAKVMKEYKDDIIEFVARDEFKKAFDQGKSEEELRLNFPKDIVDYLLKP